jgi:hypothetical protein
MSALWTYFWPACGLGLIIGVIAGAIAFRRKRAASKEEAAELPPMSAEEKRRRNIALAIGAAATIAAAALWHGPLGAADRLSGGIERGARQALAYYEMPQVHAAVQHGPLTRRLILSGQTDEFQHRELQRLLKQLPGVSRAQWNEDRGTPLILEGATIALLGFLIGLLLAYLVELRRRYNAQWNW